MKTKLLLIASIAFVSACATTSPGIKIIEQSDTKPSWATLTRTHYERDGKMFFVGYFTADGDSRPSAVTNGAGSKARAMPLESISDDFLQQSGVAEDLHESSAKFILSALRRNPPTIPGLQVTGNYYERVEIQSSKDEAPRMEIRAYSLAECPVAEYNQAKHEALARLKGDPKIKKELDEIMAKQRDQANGDAKPASAPPATTAN